MLGSYKLKKNLKNIIEDLQLDDYQKKLLEKRYLKEVIHYHYKSKLAEFFYIFFSIFVTIATIILPALLSIQEIEYSEDETIDRDFKKKIYWTTWVVSLLITISNGLVQFLNLHQQFVSYSQTKEKLLAQGWHYFELSGSYKNKSHQDNFIDFCENVEKIKKSQVNKELMFISDGQEKNETKPTKPDIPNIPIVPPTPDTIGEDQVSIKIPGTKNQNQVTSV
jgi:hypothetical protein